MAVKVWMCENFKHTHERETISFLIEEFKKHFDHDESHVFHIVCNARLENSFESHASTIDAIVVKEDAIVILEMKSTSTAVIGDDTDPWMTVTGVTLKGGKEDRNPYWQVREYRNVIANQMRTRQSAFMKSGLSKADWWSFVNGLVVLDPELVTGVDKIQIKNHSPWFKCVRKNDALKTILNFTTPGRALSQEQIEKLIFKVFGAQEAVVVNNAICFPQKKLVDGKAVVKTFEGVKLLKEETLQQLIGVSSQNTKPFLNRLSSIVTDGMTVRVFDCKTDKLPLPIKNFATHEYLICLKVKKEIKDEAALKADIELLFDVSVSVQNESDKDYYYIHWPHGELLEVSQGDAYITEIGAIHFSEIPIRDKYNRLWEVLDRMTKLIALGYETKFTSLFSRLKFICDDRKLEFYYVNKFRIRANHLRSDTNGLIRDSEYLEDLLSLCNLTCSLFSVNCSTGLSEALAGVELPPILRATINENYQKIRMTVDRWDDKYIYGYEENSSLLVKVDYKTDHGSPSVFSSLDKILFKGVELNILTPLWDQIEECWRPSQIVFAPDYLISTTELSGCVTQFVEHHVIHILNKLKADESSSALMMGNLANQFFYDLMSQDNQDVYTDSKHMFFQENPLDLCALGDMPILPLEARQQFNNIENCVLTTLPAEHQFDLSKAIIEAPFVSSSMGIQGRMDCLFFGPTNDAARVLELKSGKWDSFKGHRPQIHHTAQVSLYADILYYHSGVKREKAKALLFYSKTLPAGNYNPLIEGMLFNNAVTGEDIKRWVHLRNRIVGAEYWFMDGKGMDLLDKMTAEKLLLANKVAEAKSSKLWNEYHKPEIENMLNPIKNATPLAKAFFFRFLSFLLREKVLSKVGDEKIGSSQGISAAWNTSTEAKLENGTILIDLKVKEVVDNNGIDAVTFLIMSEVDIEATPNFRKGDSVLFYPRNSEKDDITNQIIVEGDIEAISPTEIKIILRNKQRPNLFNRTALYALEPGIHNSSSELRGLFQLLVGPEHRRNLLLNIEKPGLNLEEKLVNAHLKGEPEEIKKIVLEAKQAKDFYLLVGPPGTGKTSFAIRWMIEEFLTDPHKMILLVAYTNRAVDEICEMLEKIISRPSYLRIGKRLSCAERFQCHLEKAYFSDCPDVTAVKNKLETTRVVVGTLTSLSGKTSLFKLKHFDVAIVDEASQILEPQLLSLFCGQNDNTPYVDKFILVGDHKQLPAVVQQTIEQSGVQDPLLTSIGLTNCRNSLFERLYRLNKEKIGITGQLSTQWRMHPVIAAFASSRFYEGKLKSGEAPHQVKERCYEKYNSEDELESYIATHRLGFIPSREPSIENSHKSNRHEAVIVAHLVDCIYKLLLKNNRPFRDESLGIVVPFRNQIALIRSEIYKLSLPKEVKELISSNIDTVERYQGGSRDVILFSTTITRPYQKAILSVLGDNEDEDEPVDRKLNVAITRPREQLFITGNEALLREIPIYDNLIDWLIEKGGELNLSQKLRQ